MHGEDWAQTVELAAMGLPQEDLPLETAMVTDHGVVVQDLPVPAAGEAAVDLKSPPSTDSHHG